MIREVDLITACETAYFLQKHLGSMRQWGDFLSDNIRGRQSIEGITLMPRGRLRGPTRYAPAYSTEDIKTFIRDVKAADPSAGKPIKAVTVQLDIMRGWRISKFDRKGNPVAHHRGIVHACAAARFITI